MGSETSDSLEERIKTLEEYFETLQHQLTALKHQLDQLDRTADQLAVRIANLEEQAHTHGGLDPLSSDSPNI